MKTTDLQAMGLTEMNEAEMQSVDGGFFASWGWYVGAICAGIGTGLSMRACC